jgi:hypothetical protein
LTSTLPQRTQNLLLIVNIIMLILIIADIFYLTGIFNLEDNRLFTLVNLLGLGAGLWSFRVKRDLRERLAERKKHSDEMLKEDN